MRGHKRKFFSDSYDHIFQHALGYRVIFYSLEDRLVFYTIFSVMAWRYGVEVLTLALMFNHFHAIIHCVSSKLRALFIGTLLSMLTAITLTQYMLKQLIAANVFKNASWYGVTGFMLGAKEVQGNAKI